MTVYVVVGAVDVTVVVVVDVTVAVAVFVTVVAGAVDVTVAVTVTVTVEVVVVPVRVTVIVSALTLWGDVMNTSMARATASAILLHFPGLLTFGATARAIIGAIRYRVWGGWTPSPVAWRMGALYIPVGHLPHKPHVVYPTLVPLGMVVVEVR